jgi:hypothetical protein
VDVAFCGQTLCRRSQLNVVSPTGDHAFARSEAAAYTFVPEGGEFPIAGVGLQVGLEHHPEQWRAHYEQRLADTLSRMRGRPFEPAPVVNMLHVF